MSGSRFPSAPCENYRIDTASTNITNGAYVQLASATSHHVVMAHVYNGSTSSIYLAIGPASSEVNALILTPGMDLNVPFHISPPSRLSLKSVVTATVSSGEIVVSLFM